jgi:ribosome-binding factor A
VADRIREELAEILSRQTNDPRLGMVTVTAVEVDREFGRATIFVSSLESARRDEILAGFRSARGFLRSALAACIPLRSFPQLHFRYDASAEEGARIEDLLQKIKREHGSAD